MIHVKKRLENYIKFIESIVQSGLSADKKETFLKEMLIQIGFFQHERLIHLIVTITFALLTMLSLIGCFICDTVAYFILTILFLVLLIPYIRHYYILENGVQKLYRLYDTLNQ